jgi:hypothetical protein
MLSGERLGQRAVFILVLPRKNRVLRQHAAPESIEARGLVIAAAPSRQRLYILHDSA